MEEVLKFFAENSTFFFSTVGTDGKPKVRPFGLLMEIGGKLHLCTNNQKAVYQELMANPYCELCACSPDYSWLRLSGKAVFTKDAAAKARVLDGNPGVKELYKDAENPIFEVFCLEGATATLAQFGGPTKEFTL